MTCAMPDQNETSSGFSPAKMTWLLIIGTALMRLLLAAFTGLGNGESYYSMSVMNPDWSYFDQPGMAFWLSWCSVQLLGFNALAVRLPFVLMFIGTTWFMFLLARRLFSAKAGFYAALILNLSLVFGATTATWLQPDGPLMFFWLLGALVVSKIYFPALNEDDAKGEAVGFEVLKNWKSSLSDGRAWGLWILFGLLLGLTALSKYHAAFLLFGAGMFAIFSRRHRHWVIHPGPYLAILLMLLVASPVLIWNMQNEWASFAFQSARAGAEQGAGGLKWGWFFGSIAGQMAWMLPWIGVPLAGMLIYSVYRAYLGSLMACAWNQALQREAEVMGWCFWCAVGPIAFFTILPLWSNLGFHFHWQAPGYLMLMPVLGYVLAGLQGKLKKAVVIFGWISGGLTVVLVALLSYHTATGGLYDFGPGLLIKHLDRVKSDPTLEGYDYDDLAKAFEERGYLREENTFVISDRWHLTGKVYWALRGEKQVMCFHWDPRNIAFFHDQQEYAGWDAILVTREPTLLSEVSNCFESAEPLPDVEIIRGGRVERTLKLWRLKGFKKSYPQSYPKSQMDEVFFHERR